ncbi:uncharacterized protein WM294_015645 [Sarcoramphus papa]
MGTFTRPIAFALRLLPRLLRAPPWCRLPLRLRWLRPPPHPTLDPAPPPHVVVEERKGRCRRGGRAPAALPGNAPRRGTRPPRRPHPHRPVPSAGSPARPRPLPLCAVPAPPAPWPPIPPAWPGCSCARSPGSCCRWGGPALVATPISLWGDLIRQVLGDHDDEEGAERDDPTLPHWTDELLLPRVGAEPVAGPAPTYHF